MPKKKKPNALKRLYLYCVQQVSRVLAGVVRLVSGSFMSFLCTSTQVRAPNKRVSRNRKRTSSDTRRRLKKTKRRK